MKIQITRISPAGWRWDDDRRSAQWVHPFASALIDGHLVKVTPRRGWSCTCANDDCEHPDALAALIEPKLLRVLEGVTNEQDKRS